MAALSQAAGWAGKFQFSSGCRAVALAAMDIRDPIPASALSIMVNDSTQASPALLPPMSMSKNTWLMHTTNERQAFMVKSQAGAVYVVHCNL